MENRISMINELKISTLAESPQHDQKRNSEISLIDTAGSPERKQSTRGAEEKETNDNKIRQHDISTWNAFYLFVVVGICIVGLSLLFLLPRQNLVFYPSYWYETAIVYFFAFSSSWTADQAMSCLVYTETVFCISMRSFLMFNLIVGVAYVTSYGISNFVWVNYLQRNPPVPLLTVILLFATWIASFSGIWKMYPAELRSNVEHRKKLMFYYLYSFWFTIVVGAVLWETLDQLYEYVIPPQLEWTMAITIPAFREVNHRILSKFVKKMADKETEMADVVLSSTISSYFMTSITIRLASTSNITIYCVLFAELIIHLIMCIRVIHLQRRIDSDDMQTEMLKKKRKSNVLNIILVETIKGTIPVLYAVGLQMVFRGPNTSLFIDVFESSLNLELRHNDCDLTRVFNVMLQMIGIDVLCIIVSGIMLWGFAKINLIYEFCYLMKNYWFIITTKILRDLIIYFAGNDLNLSGRGPFIWITDVGRNMMIQNSTFLTDDEKDMLFSS